MTFFRSNPFLWHSHEPVLLFDKKGKLMDANPAAKAHFPHPTGSHVAAVLKGAPKALLGSLANGGVQQFEESRFTHSPIDKELSARIFPAQAHNGFSVVLLQVQEGTDSGLSAKAMREALLPLQQGQQEKQRAQAMQHLLPLPYLLLDEKSGAVLETNHAAWEFYGHPLRQETLEKLLSLIEGKPTQTAFHTSQQHYNKEGEPTTVGVHYQRLGAPGNQALAVLCQPENSPGHIKQLSLGGHKIAIPAYIEQASISIFITDTSTQYRYVNQAACDLLGYTCQELLNKKIVDISYEKSTDVVKGEMESVAELGSNKIEYVLEHKQGYPVYILLEAQLIEDDIFLAYCMEYDKQRAGHDHLAHLNKKLTARNNELVSERDELQTINLQLRESYKRIQQINRELLEAKGKAEESDRLKATFLTNISHEIRTPLNGIIGFSRLLKRKDLTEGQKGEYLRFVYNSGKQLLNTITDIIDISQVEAGHLSLKNSTFRVNALMEEIRKVARMQLKEKNLPLDFKINNALADGRDTWYGDEKRLRQVLTHLLDNAIKFTRTGGLEAGYDAQPRSLVFYMQDTGMGIPYEKQERIFERFYQYTPEENNTLGGTGLGLTLARALVEKMGGRIWVRSTQGKGSIFYFTLPRRAQQPLQEQVQAPNIQLLTARWEHATMLVVDDVKTILSFFESVLAPTGIQLLKAQTASRAIELVEKNPQIDLVFMDIQLPDISGYEATRRLKDIRESLPVIAQTAYANYNNRTKALAAGCDDYISKPIEEKKLLAIIKRYLA